MKILSRFFPDFLDVLRRDLYSVLSAWLAFASSLLLVWESEQHRYFSPVTLINVATAASSGIALFLAIRLWSRSRKEKDIVSAAAFLLLMTFTAWNWGESLVTVFRWGHWIFLCHLLVALSPLRSWIADTKTDTGLWRFNWHLFVRFIFALAFCGILAGGLGAALAVLSPLFGIRISSSVFATCVLFCMYIASVFQVLATLTTTDAGAPSAAVVKDLRRLVGYLMTPLALIYFAIAYAYIIKIAIVQEWPKGVVGWLVSFLVLCVFLSFVMQKPLPDGVLPAWMRKFWNLSFILLILPLATLLLGIGRRVSEYGLTEARVVLLTLALWSLGVCLIYFRPARRGMYLIPLSLTGVTLVTLLGPLSPHFLSFYSQKQLFEKIVADHGGRKGEKVYIWQTPLSFSDQRKMNSIIDYFCSMYDGHTMGETLNIPMTGTADKKIACYFPDSAIDQAIQVLGIKRVHAYQTDESNADVYESVNFSRPFTYTIGATTLSEIRFSSGGDVVAKGSDPLRFSHRGGSTTIEWISPEGKQIPIDLKDLFLKKTSQVQLKTAHGLISVWAIEGSIRTHPEPMAIDKPFTLAVAISKDETPIERSTPTDPNEWYR